MKKISFLLSITLRKTIKNRSFLLSIALLSFSSLSFCNMTRESIAEEIKSEPNWEKILYHFDRMTIEPLEERLEIARIHADSSLSEQEKINKVMNRTKTGAELAQTIQTAFKNVEEKIKQEQMYENIIAGLIIGLFVALGFLVKHYRSKK